MKLRFSATVVALALMLGQSATVLVAGLCPYPRLNQSSCDNQPVDTQASHHDMDHMQMEPDTLPVTSSRTEQVEAVDTSNGSCSHCAIHARTNGSTASLQQFYIAKRSQDGTVAVKQSPDKSIVVYETLKLPSRAHGPPGSTSSRHILISIFRI
jgi:hypothetical protein